ncbi:hypothetical protein [Yinghuangia seranimata]|uniref:hypothetical protein n=1 Tax=Yinghuangia seranimata TaxID=408067 RepID=UPI00248AA459|nr:hypothetical protein [Yinghuangia seranimata]MDI2127953.1 hypothetical protein [Yinghuangia seranimata]
MTVEWWSFIVACVALLVAIVAAPITLKLARRQTEAAEKQVQQAIQARRESLEPHVVVSFEVIRKTFNVVVQNVGQSVARDVRIVFDPPLTSAKPSEGYVIAEVTMFKKGIPTLPPGQRLTAFLDTGPNRVNSTEPMEYTATVACTGPFGVVTPEVYLLDLAVFGDVTTLDTRDIHDVADELKKINTTIKAWSPGA